MNLYEVECTVILYAVADDEAEARSLASQHISDEVDNLSYRDFDITENPDAIYGIWEHAIPYGDTTRTVGEIFAELQEKRRLAKAEEEYRKQQGNLFPEMETTHA